MSDLEGIRLIAYRCCIVEPIRQVGQTKGGLWAADAYDRHTPFVLARVIETHPSCRDVQPGQVVVTKPHAFEHVKTASAEFDVTHENNCLAVVEGFDDGLVQYHTQEQEDLLCHPSVPA